MGDLFFMAISEQAINCCCGPQPLQLLPLSLSVPQELPFFKKIAFKINENKDKIFLEM